nr:immunoglobulin light chain junction region [Macaca mulatta]
EYYCWLHYGGAHCVF